MVRQAWRSSFGSNPSRAKWGGVQEIDLTHRETNDPCFFSKRERRNTNQRRDPDSFLNWMKRMIRMRREIPEIGWGDFEVLRTSRNDVLALRYDWRNNSVVFIHNFGAEAYTVRFRSGCTGPGDERLINVLSDDHSRAGDDGRHAVVLEPHGYRWYRVGGLDYLLKRTEV